MIALGYPDVKDSTLAFGFKRGKVLTKLRNEQDSMNVNQRNRVLMVGDNRWLIQRRLLNLQALVSHLDVEREYQFQFMRVESLPQWEKVLEVLEIFPTERNVVLGVELPCNLRCASLPRGWEILDCWTPVNPDETLKKFREVEQVVGVEVHPLHRKEWAQVFGNDPGKYGQLLEDLLF